MTGEKREENTQSAHIKIKKDNNNKKEEEKKTKAAEASNHKSKNTV